MSRETPASSQVLQHPPSEEFLQTKDRHAIDPLAYSLGVGSPRPNLRVQINQIDHTLAPPGFLDNSSLHRVPVIRIYGATSIGNKACVHIHQVYPYFFVDYPGKLTPNEGGFCFNQDPTDC